MATQDLTPAEAAATDLPGLTAPNWNGTAPVQLTPKTHTTRRGLATASLCLGMWGALTFPLYPFGMLISMIGVTIGVVAVLLGVRAGNEGQHLAWVGIAFGSVGVGVSLTIYRFYQLAFEGSVPTYLFTETRLW